MSKLLIDERPLQCQPSLAMLLGSADEAIVFQQIHYWLKRTNNVQEDGHNWVYNSMTDWLKQFPWIKTRARLTRYFDDLEKRGLIITGNFNKAKFDKTKWYRIDYDTLQEFEQRLYQNDTTSVSKQDNGVSQNDATDVSKQSNPMSQNGATYTNRLPETTTRDYQENTAESTSGDATDGQQVENPFELARQCRINVNDGDHKHLFLNAINVLGKPLVCWAIRETFDGPRCSWSYLAAILNRLQKDGIKSVEEADRSRQQHSSGYSKRPGKTHYEEAMPSWTKMTEEERTRPASPERAAEVRAMLASRNRTS